MKRSWLPLLVVLLFPAVSLTAEQDYGLIKADRSPHAVMQSVDLSAVRWTGGFWGDRFRQCNEVTLPRLWKLAGPWAWNNMRVAAGLKAGEAKGCDWEDAWIYKWIEAACYVYSQTRDPKLLEQMDEIIAVVAKAQQPDGYLATQVTLRNIERFSSYRHHEVYTMGHLMTAACAPADHRQDELPPGRPSCRRFPPQRVHDERERVPGQLPGEPLGDHGGGGALPDDGRAALPRAGQYSD